METGPYYRDQILARARFMIFQIFCKTNLSINFCWFGFYCWFGVSFFLIPILVWNYFYFFPLLTTTLLLLSNKFTPVKFTNLSIISHSNNIFQQWKIFVFYIHSFNLWRIILATTNPYNHWMIRDLF